MFNHVPCAAIQTCKAVPITERSNYYTESDLSAIPLHNSSLIHVVMISLDQYIQFTPQYSSQEDGLYIKSIIANIKIPLYLRIVVGSVLPSITPQLTDVNYQLIMMYLIIAYGATEPFLKKNCFPQKKGHITFWSFLGMPKKHTFQAFWHFAKNKHLQGIRAQPHPSRDVT